MLDGLRFTRRRLSLDKSMEFLLSSSLSVSDDGIIRCARSKVIEVLRARGAGGQVRRIPDLYCLGVLYNDSSMLQLQRNCLVSMIAQDVSKKIALALLIGLWLSFQSILWWQQQRWNRIKSRSLQFSFSKQHGLLFLETGTIGGRKG